MTEITMPKLSDTMLEGTLVKWLKKIGEQIEVGDAIAEIETDKATMEMESFEEGVLTDVLVPEGGTVQVGECLAILDGDGQATPTKKQSITPAPQSSTPATPVSRKVLTPATPKPRPKVSADSQRIKASPLAKKIAQERGVDLSAIAGSGPGGRIVAIDVPERDKSQGASASAVQIDVPFSETDKRIPLSGMRRTIAERLLVSKTQIPHFYLSLEIDASPLVEVRKEINATAETSGGSKMTVNDFVLLATARAAMEHPKINSAFAGDAIVEYSTVHLAVAIAVDDGLMTPILRHAQNMTLREMSLAVKDLAARARTKKLKPEEYQGGTITVSNLGAFGVENFYAIINPPQAAILSVGAIIKKPIVDARDQILVGQRMSLGLSGDHRVIDGASGAQFLNTIKKHLESPATLLI